MDLAESVGGSERESNVQLASEFGVVLVQQVIERLVQGFAVDQNHSAALSHAKLHLL